MMYFKDEEVEAIKSIFKRLECSTLNSLQYYTKENELRTACTMAIYNKWKKPVCVFQNFNNLSPYRMKLLKQLAAKITYPLHITQPREDIMRIGWKIEKPLG